MTQGKKKKRAANRSIMLAKKIIIKDGGTVSVEAPARAQLPRSPAWGAPSPPALLSPPPPRSAVSAAGRGVSGACGLGPRAPGRGEEASAAHQAQRGARGGRAALSSICFGGWPPPPPAGSGYVRCPVVVAGAGAAARNSWARGPGRRLGSLPLPASEA